MEVRGGGNHGKADACSPWSFSPQSYVSVGYTLKEKAFLMTENSTQQSSVTKLSRLLTGCQSDEHNDHHLRQCVPMALLLTPSSSMGFLLNFQ